MESHVHAAGRSVAVGRRAVDRDLRVLRRLMAAVGVAYALSVLPVAGNVVAPVVAPIGGANNVALAALVVLLAVRAVVRPEDRAAWACFSAGLAAYLAGSVAHSLYYQHLSPVPRPSWSDAGWMSFYPLAYAALVLMLRSRVRRVSASTWLDGVVAGLTAAAFAAGAALGASLRAADGSFAVVSISVAYPTADLLLLVLLGGALAVIGRGAGASWWWLTAGMGVVVATDTLYAYQMAHGTYVEGGPLDPLWAVAFGCFGVAGCQVGGTRRVLPLEGMRRLIVPGVCALAALGLLFSGYLSDGDAVAGTLALGAVLAALVRTALTFREVQALADSRRQARTDELTGLPNRRSVYEALRAADLRLAAGEDLAVLVIDLDRFKEVNDSFGHSAGDALLRQAGPRLRGELRQGDVLGRLGGDEFVVLARGLDPGAALDLARRLREQLQRPFRYGGLQLSVDASVGVAVGPEQSSGAEELLQLADLAMYAAKSTRSGAAVYDEERDGQGRHRLEAIEQLRRAIAEGELTLYYQPKLALPAGTVDGVEALVRWQHPTRGLLGPAEFVDLAESAGLMAQLTSAVLDLALAQCRAWRDDGRALSVAVNVSPSNLVDERFPDEVTGLLARHGLPAGALTLEVTESLLMEDRERAVRVLTGLRDAGVGVSIDDYGTGYSSLAYLAVLPVTELKLDRAFVSAMAGSTRSAAIVTSTLQLAQALGLRLVAEGVEDQATLDALADLGCDVVQGYHVSRPLPPDQLAGWLEARRAAEREPEAANA